MTDVLGSGAVDSRRAIVQDALRALDDAGVAHALRNGSLTLDDPPADLDILDPAPPTRRAPPGADLRGLAPAARPRSPGHRFYLREADDLTWVKLDVVTELRYGTEVVPIGPAPRARRRVDGLWLVSDEDARAHAEHRAAGRGRSPRRSNGSPARCRSRCADAAAWWPCSDRTARERAR